MWDSDPIQGCPGSETALGDFLQEGCAAKVADTLMELANIWETILGVLDHNKIKMSAPKTLIAPTSAVILGLKLQQGTLTATSHRISTLSTCSQLKTVKGLRSFLGAYRFLSRVLSHSS